VSNRRHSANFFIFLNLFCRVPSLRHSANFFIFLKCHFVECLRITLGKVYFYFLKSILPSAPWHQHSAK
jgi:hypothetical protein